MRRLGGGDAAGRRSRERCAALAAECAGPFKPRLSAEALEDLARLGQQRLGFLGPPLRYEPARMLELRDGEVEWEHQLAEEPRGPLEQPLCIRVLRERGQTGTEPERLRPQELCRASGRYPVDE